MAEVDNQTQALCKSAPGFAVLFVRAMVESCVWKSFVSELPPSEWKPEMVGSQVMEFPFLLNEAGGKVGNSFRSKTAALRAEWAYLLYKVGKVGFSEKGHWGFKSYRARRTVEGKVVEMQVFQGILPIFVENGPVMDIEAVKAPAASPAPAAPAVSEEVRAEQKTSAVANALAIMGRRRNKGKGHNGEQDNLPVEASVGPGEAAEEPTEANPAE